MAESKKIIGELKGINPHVSYLYYCRVTLYHIEMKVKIDSMVQRLEELVTILIIFLLCMILQFYRLLAKEESVRETIDSDGKTESEYEYIQDHKYTGSPYHSQPCFSLGGSSYTPPGWKRLYKEKQTFVQKSAKD